MEDFRVVDLGGAVILGTDVTCPQCQQNDGTQRVSLLENMIQGDMTPRQMDILTMDVNRGVAQEWRGVPKNGTWAGLAEQLAPPPKPELTGLSRLSGRFVYMRFTRYIGFFVIVISLFAFGGAGMYFGPVWVPFVCIFWIAALIAIWRLVLYIRDAEQRLIPKVEDWSRRMSVWNHLYYCARDNGVFAPGARKLVAPEKMSELLQSA